MNYYLFIFPSSCILYLFTCHLEKNGNNLLWNGVWQELWYLMDVSFPFPWSTTVQVVIGFLGFAIFSIQISQPTFNWRCVKSKVLQSYKFIVIFIVLYFYDVAPFIPPSHFKWKLIFGSPTPFHVATSNNKSTNAQIAKDTFPIHQLEPS